MNDQLLRAEQPLIEQPPVPDTLLRLSGEQAERVNLIQARPWTSPKDQCLTCNKANDCTYLWYRTGSRREGDIVRYRCRCEDQWRMFRWMSWAGIGLNYMRLDWEDQIELENTEALDAVYEYAKHGRHHANSGNNMVLWSPQPGPGKTFLASMLAKRMLVFGFDVFFATIGDILNMYTSGWRNEAARAYFDERVRTTEILVIDDIGREHPGRAEVVRAMMDEILRFRVANCLATVVTTNLQPEEFSVYGTNVVSLLAERMFKVKVDGRDKRDDMTKRADREYRSSLTRPIVMS